MSPAIKTLVLLGPAGSFSDLASLRLGKLFKKRYVKSFSDLFKAVDSGKCYGLVPVHNKIIGKIPQSADVVKKRQYHVSRRFRLRVSMVLAAKKSATLQGIRRVYAPLVVKKQCEKFLGKILPHAKFSLKSGSSSSAFKKVVQLSGNSAAAIGSEAAAKLYKLQVLARNVQDDPKDWTEFVVVSPSVFS